MKQPTRRSTTKITFYLVNSIYFATIKRVLGDPDAFKKLCYTTLYVLSVCDKDDIWPFTIAAWHGLSKERLLLSIFAGPVAR